jgi:spermidine/putrescine-binding protein
LARAQGQTVNVHTWDTYIGENTLEEFTDATGIQVVPQRPIRPC